MTTVAACVLLAAAGVGSAGCATSRAALSEPELRVRADARRATIEKYRGIVAERLVRRMIREADVAHARGERAVVDILILSGGGDQGAFGAGFLQGWGAVKGEGPRRPEFDVVSGVSTGALIAPFAFVGSELSYERIARIYSEPKAGWFQSRGLLNFLAGASSYMESRGLRRDIEKEVDAATIAAIAAGEKDDRTLWVGTTDLDLGVHYPWDLTYEAKRIAERGNSPKRFYDVLMASAAIPVIFPPVVIDDTLYVDGGTTSNILFDGNILRADGPIARFRAERPDLPLPIGRYWVIINNKLDVEERIVQPTWRSITEASLSTAIRASTIGSLRQVEMQARLARAAGVDVEFRYVCVPEDWEPPERDLPPFDKRLMDSLMRRGRELGAKGDAWRESL